MIKLMLSHFILETCVNNFFNALVVNFPIASIIMDKLELGSYINVSIVVNFRQYILKGCKLVDRQDNTIWLEYIGFHKPILLIATDGKLVDIIGDHSVISDLFTEAYL